MNRNKLEPQDPNYITETGKAYGLDISLKVEAKRAYLWGAYSLGFVTRFDGEQEYPPVFDRRHNLNLVGTYQLGKKNNGNWVRAGILDPDFHLPKLRVSTTMFPSSKEALERIS